jgi:transmembrane protein EpsG
MAVVPVYCKENKDGVTGSEGTWIMTVIWMNLAIVYFVSLFSRFASRPARSSLSPELVKPNQLMALVVIGTFVLVSGLRNNIGDTYFYMHSYAVDTHDLLHILMGKDIGFGFLQMGLKYFSKDPQFLIFTVALLTNVLIVRTFFQYSRMVDLSVYVFITSGLYVVSMNGIRQFLAAALVFAATKYIFTGSWLKYFLVVLVASTIHQSALLLIPIYFIVRRKAWTGGTFLMLGFAIFIAIGYGQFSGAIFSALEGSQYANYKEFNEGGANAVRVVVEAVPIFLAYLGRHKLREMFPKSDYVVNMALLGLVFMVIATQNWIFARFVIYFGLYNLILISWVVKLFVKQYQRIVYYGIIVCYFLYFYYDQVVVLNLVYKSDYLKF